MVPFVTQYLFVFLSGFSGRICNLMFRKGGKKTTRSFHTAFPKKVTDKTTGVQISEFNLIQAVTENYSDDALNCDEDTDIHTYRYKKEQQIK